MSKTIVKNTTDDENKFSQFFNEEKRQIINMSNEELLERINELRSIAIEARARLVSIEDEIRTRRKKK